MINRFLNEFMFDWMQNRTYQKTFDVIICLNSYLKCKLLQAFIFVIHSFSWCTVISYDQSHTQIGPSQNNKFVCYMLH